MRALQHNDITFGGCHHIANITQQYTCTFFRGCLYTCEIYMNPLSWKMYSAKSCLPEGGNTSDLQLLTLLGAVLTQRK